MGKIMKAKSSTAIVKKTILKAATGRNDTSAPIMNRAVRGEGLKFKLETYQTVSSFEPGTRIKYAPNPKTPGSKSFVRYGKYENAKTVGEALKCGTKLADLCWELERRIYTVLGEVRSEAAEKKALGDKSFNKAKADLERFQGPRGLNVQMTNPKAVEALKKEEDWREKKLAKVKELVKLHKIHIENEDELNKMGIHEGHELHAERKTCDFMSELKLNEAAKTGRKFTEKDVKDIIELWGFAQNTGRLNVMHDGIKYVYSDTIGAIRRRCQGYGCTPPTKHYPNFVRFLCKWLKDCRVEEQIGCDFKFTAINLNANYAGRRHRDGSNEGPSVIRAVGDFTGGKLLYWPKDENGKRSDVMGLHQADSVTFDIEKEMVVFDGCRAHEVTEFKGNRYSLVFFSASGYRKLQKEDLKYMQSVGFPVPTPQAMTELKAATKKLVCAEDLLGGLKRKVAGKQIKKDFVKIKRERE